MTNPTPKEDLIVVNLSPEEAKLFVAFQKRHAFMELLESVGAFDIKGGYVTVHFDNNGGIGSVDVQRRYRML